MLESTEEKNRNNSITDKIRENIQEEIITTGEEYVKTIKKYTEVLSYEENMLKAAFNFVISQENRNNGMYSLYTETEKYLGTKQRNRVIKNLKENAYIISTYAETYKNRVQREIIMPGKINNIKQEKDLISSIEEVLNNYTITLLRIITNELLSLPVYHNP